MNDPKQSQFEEIEAYLSGKLTGKALSDLKNKLTTDPEFAVKVKLHKELAHAIASEAAEKEFKKILEEEGKKYLPQTAKVRKLSFVKWAAAAAIILLLGSLFILNNRAEKEGPQASDLFAQSYQAPALIVAERSTGTPIDKELQAAYDAYTANNFTLAAKLLDPLTTPNQKSEINYYAAISHISADPPNIAKAIQLLDQVSRDEESSYQAAAKWYLALAILKIGDKQVAKKVFEEIAATGPAVYKRKAIELLKKYQ